jgi:hypothetical protein
MNIWKIKMLQEGEKKSHNPTKKLIFSVKPVYFSLKGE